MREGAAFERACAARVGRRLPAVVAAVRDGRLHSSAVLLLAPRLIGENHGALMAEASGKSTREAESHSPRGQVRARGGAPGTARRRSARRARRLLELHHERPYARGGAHTARCLTPRCRLHDDPAARDDFGEARVRRSIDRRRTLDDASLAHAARRTAPHGCSGAPRLDVGWGMRRACLTLLAIGCSSSPDGDAVVGSVVDTFVPRAARAAAPAGDLYAGARAAGLEVLVDDRLLGSGFVVDEKGLAITAAHVVAEPGRRIEVRSALAGRVTVRLVAVDRGHDLALLQLPAQGAPYAALPLAERPPRPAEEVYLYGVPMWRHGVLLRGAIAAAAPTYEFLPEEAHYVRVLYVSASTQHGTSGGPWVDASGRVVGMQTALVRDGGNAVGIAAMTPVGAIHDLLERRQDARTPTLGVGVEEMWEQNRDFLGRFPPRTEGVVVARVRTGGPGDKVGLRAFDVVTHVGGERVRLRDELLRRVRTRSPGDRLKLKVLRQGRAPLELELTLGRLEAVR